MNQIQLTTESAAPATMSSREIAQLTGKEHRNVMRDILAMLTELKEDVLTFKHIYLDSMNRKQTEYLLDRELTETLLTGYSAVLRRKVIARWRELERNGGLVTGQESLADARVTLLERLRSSGVMSQSSAERAGFMLLGLRPPRAARAAAAPVRQMELIPAPVTPRSPAAKKLLKITVSRPSALHHPDGVQFILSEVADFVAGGLIKLTTSMISHGLIDAVGQPTTKGKAFIGSRFKGAIHWRVSALLRHLSA